MKKLLAPAAAIVLALTVSGCMTAKSVTKSVTAGCASLVEALSKDTNACRLRVNAVGVTIEFERNIWGHAAAASGGFSVTPITTLQVQPAK